MHLTKCYSAETSNCYSVSILPFFSRNRTQVLGRNIQLDIAMLLSSGKCPQAPAAPCQPLCFRLGLGLSKADSPDETRASPATSPPACKVSGLHWGQRTTQKPSWSRVGGQSCRAGFPESEQPARRAPCPCPAEPRTSGQSRTESLIHSKSCSSLDSGDTQRMRYSLGLAPQSW